MILASAIRIAYQGVSFLAMVLIVRFLGLEEFGQISVVISTSVVAALFATFGMPAEILRLRLAEGQRFTFNTYLMLVAIVSAALVVVITTAAMITETTAFAVPLFLLSGSQVLQYFGAEHFKAQQKIYEHDFLKFGAFPVAFLVGTLLELFLFRSNPQSLTSMATTIAEINAGLVLVVLVLLGRRKSLETQLIQVTLSRRNVRHFAIYYISPLASLGVLHMSVLFVNWAFSNIETSWYALGVRLFGVLLLPFSFLVSYSTKEIVTSDAYSVALWPRLRLLGITLLGVVALFASIPMLRWLMSSDVIPAILIAAILAAGIFPRAFTFDANTALQFRINPALHLVFTSVSIVALTFAALPSAHLGIYYFSFCMSAFNALPGAISLIYLRTRKDAVS